MAKKNTITSVPKAIRNEVKALLEHAKNTTFEVVIVYVDNQTGLAGIASRASSGFHSLVNQARSNYVDIRTALHAAFNSGVKHAKTA